MTARFDLEQQIMETWQIVDDLKLFREILDSEEFAWLSAAFTDKIDNYMLALITIYGYRFERTFRTFEKVCAEFRHQNNT